jgi:ABC-type dipeptide/oligopeptide/nickel transport system ATPase component
MNTILQVTSLGVSYVTHAGSKTIVSGVSFTADSATMTGLVGESGSGKSATVHAIASLPRSVQAVVTGSVKLKDHDILGASQRNLRRIHGGEIGFVGQNPFGCLHPVLPLHKQFHYILEAHHKTKSRSDSRDQASAALESVGIRQPMRALDGYAHELSGGMAQRVVIAMATVLKPALLIADEPTTALDATVQVQILDLLDSLRKQDQMAILIVTHDMGVVANYCQSALVMKDGIVVEQGPIRGLYEHPSNPYTRELFTEDSALREGMPG